MTNTFGYKVGDIFEYQYEDKQLWIIEEKCLDLWGMKQETFAVVLFLHCCMRISNLVIGMKIKFICGQR